jgi:hypothetical protein
LLDNLIYEKFDAIISVKIYKFYGFSIANGQIQVDDIINKMVSKVSESISALIISKMQGKHGPKN